MAVATNTGMTVKVAVIARIFMVSDASGIRRTSRMTPMMVTIVSTAGSSACVSDVSGARRCHVSARSSTESIVRSASPVTTPITIRIAGWRP